MSVCVRALLFGRVWQKQEKLTRAGKQIILGALVALRRVASGPKALSFFHDSLAGGPSCYRIYLKLPKPVLFCSFYLHKCTYALYHMLYTYACHICLYTHTCCTYTHLCVYHRPEPKNSSSPEYEPRGSCGLIKEHTLNHVEHP